MCSKWALWCCRHIWIRRAKFLMTLPHSSPGIALIAAFRSGIVWGLLPYTLSLRYPHRQKSGGFKSGECGDHCGSHLRLISRSGKRCCSHANDSFQEWVVTPSCWNQWRILTTPLRRPSAVQNLPSTWTYRSVLIISLREIAKVLQALHVDNSVSDCSNIVWCPWMISVVQSVIVC